MVFDAYIEKIIPSKYFEKDNEFLNTSKDKNEIEKSDFEIEI